MTDASNKQVPGFRRWGWDLPAPQGAIVLPLPELFLIIHTKTIV